MNITLTPEFQASGRYGSESAVIHEGLRLLRERENELEKFDDLRREVALGIEDAEQGKTAPLNAQETLGRVRQNRDNKIRKQP